MIFNGARRASKSGCFGGHSDVRQPIMGLATRNSGFWDDQYMNSTLGLATYIGFSDLNRVDENSSLNPAGTVFANED